MTINKNSMQKLIIVVVMATLFFSMAPSLVHTMSTGVSDFLGSISGNTTLYGSGPSSIATVVNNNWGYFLVIGVLTLVIGIASSLFYLKRR